MVIGPSGWVVSKGARFLGRTAVDANLALLALPVVNSIPVRRMGFGLAMFLDPEGSNLLDFLGDDLEERATTLDHFLSGCSEDEMNELLIAFQEAVQRRARRAAAQPASPKRNSTRRSSGARAARSSGEIAKLQSTIDQLSAVVDELAQSWQGIDS
jgi:hypothetical protein